MINYLKNLHKKFVNASWKYKVSAIFILIVYLFFMLISLISIDVFVEDDLTSTTPGTVNKVSNVIDIESNYEIGNIYTVSVYSYRRLSLLQYWLSKMNDDIDIEEDSENFLTDDEINIQGKIMKDVSITNAMIVAYTEAKKVNSSVNIDYEYEGVIIHTLWPYADNQLSQSDIISEVEGQKFNSKEEFSNLISSFIENDYIKLTIKNEDNIEEKNIKVNEIVENGERRRILGISGYSKYRIKSATPEYTINSSSTIGPSGGLMQALAIYDALTEGDLTHNLTIMGTGTIEVDSEQGFGTVGAIGGVAQKIITTNIYKADVVFIPSDNYVEAIAQYNKISNPHYNKPIEAITFSQVISELNKLGEQ